MRHVALAAAAGVGLGCAGVARSQELVSHSFDIIEVVAGTNTPVANPDGVLQPGEAARIQLTVTYTPGAGSNITFPLPPGQGVVGGFGYTGFDLVPTAPQAGTWSFLGRRSPWNAGTAGVWSAATSVLTAEVGQVVPPGGVASPENPLNAVWWGVWTPASYTPRAVTFAGQNSDLRPTLLVRYGQGPQGEPLYLAYRVDSQYNQVVIPIVPAPACGALLLGVAGLRRRRASAG